MKGIVYHAKGDVRIEELPVPVPDTDEILVKVDACAVCGSDLKAFKSGNPRLKPPITMGHEFTGLIEAPAKSSDGFVQGDRVVMATSISCGECYYCRKGWKNLCRDLAPMGFSYNGGMAEWVVIPERAIRNGHLIKVSGTVAPHHAALAEPLSCAVNAVEGSGVTSGDTVVVIGAGPMGILNAVAARSLGAGKIIMAEINSRRLKQCDSFGFDILVNPEKEDLKEVVLNETEGYGADVVVVAAPARGPQEKGLELVRKKGTLCLFASLPAGSSNITLDSRIIHYNEIHVTGSSDSTPGHVQEAVEMIASPGFPGDILASHILPLEGVFEAFELMKSGEALRVVLEPK